MDPKLWIATGYLAVSLLTIGAYAFDKRRATYGGPRVPERTLHLLELCGGWPGALVARRVFRHKTHKLSFSLVLFAIVLLHMACWSVWYIERHGA